jgi:hypothetical protein
MPSGAAVRGRGHARHRAQALAGGHRVGHRSPTLSTWDQDAINVTDFGAKPVVPRTATAWWRGLDTGLMDS